MAGPVQRTRAMAEAPRGCDGGPDRVGVMTTAALSHSVPQVAGHHARQVAVIAFRGAMPRVLSAWLSRRMTQGPVLTNAGLGRPGTSPGKQDMVPVQLEGSSSAHGQRTGERSSLRRRSTSTLSWSSALPSRLCTAWMPMNFSPTSRISVRGNVGLVPVTS